MANIFDAAKYILEKEGAMSTAKLQKLCYFSQIWSIVWNDDALFPEEFLAWPSGPVCQELFEATRGRYEVAAADIRGNAGNLSDFQKETVDTILKYYGPRDFQWLNQMAILGKPWKDARRNTQAGEGPNVITKESLAMFYGGLDE